jgi:hypothetical protein
VDIPRKKGAFGWFCSASSVVLDAASRRRNIPVPEYFGIYAISDGQLIKLDAKEIRASKNVSVRMGQRQAVSGVLNGAPVATSQSASVPVFSPDLKIVVYLQSGGMLSPLQMAEPLRIEPLVFVRNLSVDTGFPEQRPSQRRREWVGIRQFARVAWTGYRGSSRKSGRTYTATESSVLSHKYQARSNLLHDRAVSALALRRQCRNRPTP